MKKEENGNAEMISAKNRNGKTEKVSAKELFEKQKIVPAVVQDWKTGEVLCLFYVDSEALEKTIETKKLWRYSRRRREVIMKGAESGNVMEVKGISADCDNDALLIEVEVNGKGKACHTGKKSCFFNKIYEKEGENGRGWNEKNGNAERKKKGSSGILEELEDAIIKRKNSPKKGSYTSEIMEKEGEIERKIEEESAEYIEALEKKGRKDIVWEASDLIYFTLAGLAKKNIKLEEVFAELERRRKK